MQEATRPGRRARQRRRTSRPRAATRDATPFWAVQGYELSTDTRPAVTPRPPATATQPRRVPKTRLWHALEYGPIWTQKGPSRISPKQPLTCGDAGGRYWDRTSDLFRVRQRHTVRSRSQKSISCRSGRCAVPGELVRTGVNLAGLLHALLHGSRWPANVRATLP